MTASAATSLQYTHNGPPYPVSADELSALLSETGFQVDRIDILPSEQKFENAQKIINFLESSSFGNGLGLLPPELRNDAAIEIRNELVKLEAPQGIIQGVAAFSLSPRSTDQLFSFSAFKKRHFGAIVAGILG